MSKLSRSQFLQLSVMLFGLFFGAGNLIFPPLLGNQAGSAMFLALLSFAVTAVIFPVLGTIAVGKTGGLSVLARRVGPPRRPPLLHCLYDGDLLIDRPRSGYPACRIGAI